MERFVGWIVTGGLSALGGLWAVALAAAWSVPWLAGIAAALLGACGVGYGIASRVTLRE